MKKKLRRSEESKVIFGVLGGLATYFEQDPVLYRVLAITFLIFTGIFPGLLLYLAAWLVMPKQPPQDFDYEVVE